MLWWEEQDGKGQNSRRGRRGRSLPSSSVTQHRDAAFPQVFQWGLCALGAVPITFKAAVTVFLPMGAGLPQGHSALIHVSREVQTPEGCK